MQYLTDDSVGPHAKPLGAAAKANCVSVFVTGVAGRYRADVCDPAGREIRFCGHGALAAAMHVFNKLEPDLPELNFFNQHQQWQARRAGAADADILLVYKRPPLTRCDAPAFAPELLGVSPLLAAEAGGADNYLILELASPDDVLKLVPNFGAFSAATRRAVIVTARDPALKGIVFRYFAPQYGQPEDSATGSAAVQLGAYWESVIGSACYPVRQLSAGGALMQLRCADGTVELSARVAYR